MAESTPAEQGIKKVKTKDNEVEFDLQHARKVQREQRTGQDRAKRPKVLGIDFRNT